MPSPFPGMDPYLEDSSLWPDLHQSMITYLRDALNEVLPPEYRARMAERVYVVTSGRDIWPDVSVMHRPRSPEGRRPDSSAAAVAEMPFIVHTEASEVREVFVEVVSRRAGTAIVTVIEVLSPSNKTPGHVGSELYRRKQREVLGSTTHLVEIDLLRQGEHVLAIPKDELWRVPPYDYLICASRYPNRFDYEVYPVSIRQPLPTLRVPLTDGKPDAVVDLQAIFDQVYDRADYAADIDYAKPPPAALSEQDAAWAGERLRDRGRA